MTRQLRIKSGKKLIPLVWSGAESDISYSVRLTGRGAGVTLLLLLIGRQDNSVSVNINIFHEARDTSCRVLIKGVLLDRSKADITGLVNIKHGSVDSSAWLAAHLLLLSDRASGRVVPNLEILENEVKAGHATSVGRINQDELFYLQSRGLPEKIAKSLLVRGFFHSLIESFPRKLQLLAEKELQHVI